MEQVQKHGKLLWLLAVPIFIAVLSAINITLGSGMYFAIFLLLFISVIIPIKKLGINSRKIALGSFILISFAIGIFIKDEETLRLETLKSDDPVSYLNEIKVDNYKLWLKESRSLAPDEYLQSLEDTNPSKWIKELKTLKPDEYLKRASELQDQKANLEAKVQQNRLAKIEALKGEALAIPASDYVANIKAYKELSRLEPGNQSYKDKIAKYKAKQKAAKVQASRCGRDSYSDAYFYGKEYVKLSLKAPSTAKFGGYYKSSVQHYRGCKFVVRGYVDSQNGFGAMLRSNYSVTLSPSGLGWKLEDIQIN